MERHTCIKKEVQLLVEKKRQVQDVGFEPTRQCQQVLSLSP